MFKLLAILLVGLVFEAVGVVFLSKGLKEVGEMQQINVAEIVRVVKAGLTNPRLLLGVFFEALFFGCLLVLMARSDISFIWPLTSLGFVLTTLAARFVLHERVVTTRWLGVCCIVLGAGLITWTEHHKPAAAPQPAPLDPPPADSAR
ncbi:MAG: EamA family transporter [Verrucomicrobiales bacterium]|nr:EamA family transporter [Verrucomicrobiales bacterium]MCP5528031.1 EamA family transporter [Verrucomicrobiales bacterium]